MFKMNKKKILIYTALVLFYTGLTEITLRLFDPEVVFVKTFDDDILFSLYPNKNGKVISEEYNVTVNTNSEGGRQTLSDEHYQILLLGDSFAEGWGVEESEIFTSVANRENIASQAVRNMGVHGSSPALFYIHLKKYIEVYKPKFVWLQLFDNDLDDLSKIEPYINVNHVDGIPTPKKPAIATIFGTSLYNFIKESSIFRLAKRAAKFVKGGTEPILYYKIGREPKVESLSHTDALKKFGSLMPLGETIANKYNGQFSFYKHPDEQVWVDRFSKETRYLNLIFQLLRNKNIELGIIYIPAKEFFAKGGILGDISRSELKEYESRNPHYQNINSFCTVNQIRCLMGTKILWNQNPESLYFPYDAHWNKNGHEVFGKIFAEEIRKSFPTSN